MGVRPSVGATVPYFYVPNGGASTNYGYLYNYKAVSLGICPTGWHVPTSSELQALANYVGSQNAYICGNNSNYVAKALASTSGWNSSTITCTPGETPSNNNATGFSALPAGARLSNSYSNFGSCAYFWSASEVSNNNSYAWIHCIGHSSQGVSTLYGDKSEGYAVRCVKD